MLDNIIQTIKENAINAIKTRDNFSDVCSKIYDNLIEEFNGVWQCFVYKTSFGAYSINRKYNGKCIKFSISDLTSIIFETRN